MHPELFTIPFTHLTVKSYGTMMVVGFLAAVYVIRRLSKDITPDAQMITNASLYALIAGVVGARVFYVLHYFDRFRGDLLSVFAVWQGGLELLGGVLAAIGVITIYLRLHKLPVRQYLDILAVGLMLALGFGRIGCFLNGCCYGRPADVPCAVRFPYGSLAYRSQIEPNPARNRYEPQLRLPDDFFGYYDESGNFDSGLKPFKDLTAKQQQQVRSGKYRCLAVHPTELYSSANGFVLCIILYLFWRRTQKARRSDTKKFLTAPGCTFSLMFILYGITRLLIEFVRDDNPFEYGFWAVYKGGTISQNLSIYMIVFGVALLLLFEELQARPGPKKS